MSNEVKKRNCGLRIADCGLGITDFGLRIADCELERRNYGLRIADRKKRRG